jgi:hypothetical protein
LKLFTRQTMDEIAEALEQFGLVKIRRGLSVLNLNSPIVSAIAFLPREWPDDVFTVSIYVQAIWEEVESEYFRLLSKPHTRLSMPTCSVWVNFDPPLSFSRQQVIGVEIQRLVEWYKVVGKEACEKISTKDYILAEHERNLSIQKYSPRPELTFLVMRQMNVALSIAQERIFSALTDKLLRDRFEEFLLVYKEKNNNMM